MWMLPMLFSVFFFFEKITHWCWLSFGYLVVFMLVVMET